MPKEHPVQKIVIANPEKNQEPAVKQNNSFISLYRLKSIVEIKKRYIAALQEVSHYGSQSDPGEQTPSDSGGRTFVVVEGDTINGEKVVRIRENFVVMFKDGSFYKLSFSGGMSIEKLEEND